MDSGDSAGSWVRLNVGGKIFETTKETLRGERGSFFAHLVEYGMRPSVKDESGAYMIDRSPEHMDTILNYMRSGHLSISDRSVLAELASEADFYGLAVLTKLLEAESKKTKSREVVYVLRHSDYVYIILPTSESTYDVRQELKSDRHFPHISDYSNGMLYKKSSGVHTFMLVCSHVTKVVTALGFEVESEEKDKVSFVRYVFE